MAMGDFLNRPIGTLFPSAGGLPGHGAGARAKDGEPVVAIRGAHGAYLSHSLLVAAQELMPHCAGPRAV